MKLQVYGNSKWLSEPFSRHQNKIRIRSYKEKKKSRNTGNTLGCDASPAVPICAPVFSASQSPPECAHSLRLQFISLSNSEDIPRGLVYSLKWPYSPKTFVFLFVLKYPQSKSWQPETIWMYFTHLDWSIIPERGSIVYIYFFSHICWE